MQLPLVFTATQTLNFWQKVDRSGPNGCWLWTAGKDKGGYGMFQLERRWERAHRIAFALSNPTITQLRCALHHCDNPACVNPVHLFAGTAGDNNKDRHAKGRDAVGEKHGSRTHPEKLCRGEEVNTAVLTAELVLAIRAEREKLRTPFRQLARQFGISKPAAQHIVARRTWKHV